VRLDFTKMHGCGNDYIYVVALDRAPPADAPALARRLSRRRFSIGSDGLVFILPGERAPFRMRIWNADGSEAEMCGNAIRCVAKLLFDRGFTRETTIPIETGNGVLEVTVHVESGRVARATVSMGVPRLEPGPLELSAGDERVSGTIVSMGNPHFVLLDEDLSDERVLRLGPLIEKHERFPPRTNVEFVKLESPDRLRVRVWERGSGETLACGTGACAAFAAADVAGRTVGNVTVSLPGGDLECSWGGIEMPMLLSGPCEVAYEGSVEID
jgi:diaminopimelate epimerase